MRLRLRLCFAIITLCLACQPDKPTQEKPKAHSQDDSALRNYVKTTFDISSEQWNMRYQDGPKYLNYRRYSKEITLYPGNFKFSVYHFGDGQSFRPFVIKVLTPMDSTITYFAFGDERYYASNSVSGSLIDDKLEMDSSVETDTSLRSLLNLEKNLNQLIIKLNYQYDKSAIYSLLDIMFDNLLRMKLVDYAEVDVYLSQLKRANKKGNANAAIKEFTMLRNQIDDKTFCVHAKDGSHGYWIFEIIEDKGSYHVKPTFVGDLLYSQVYF